MEVVLVDNGHLIFFFIELFCHVQSGKTSAYDDNMF